MRKVILLVLILVICAAAAMAFMLQREERVWSSTSVEATREFELGMAAEMKFYTAEAKKHYDRAASLDPKFALAAVKSKQHSAHGPTRREAILKELNFAKQQKLSDHERMIVDILLARVERNPTKMSQVLDDYLDEHPNDSYALNLRCGEAWDRKDFDVASKCYSKLLEKDPNWVNAQNNLGYIAMAQARFDDAEESFKTYRYIAPDQANPHDSLGELYTVVGRYDEAERELKKALEVRSDFCASHSHLIFLYSMTDQPEKARTTSKAMKSFPLCASDAVSYVDCNLELWALANRKQWAAVVETAKTKGCMGKSGDADVIAHGAALHLGDKETVAMIEQKVREQTQKYKAPDGSVNDSLQNHLLGARAAFEGNHPEAIRLLQKADDRLVYWGDGEAMFKLYNLASLENALRDGGREAEADKILQRINSINPRFMQSQSALLLK